MFGNRYFGVRYFGDRYFGPGGEVSDEELVGRRRRTRPKRIWRDEVSETSTLGPSPGPSPATLAQLEKLEQQAQILLAQSTRRASARAEKVLAQIEVLQQQLDDEDAIQALLLTI